MKLSDRILFSLNWRLCSNDAGIAVYRLIRWITPRLCPYEPPPCQLSAATVRTHSEVQVRFSTIAGAGQGLFAVKAIPAGQMLGEYGGDRIDSLAKWIRLRNKDYVMQTDDPTVYIDAARHPEALMRYVNHHFDAQRQNVVRQVRGEQVYYLTTRAVAAGEELFIDYGDLYWKLRGVQPSDVAA